jgi:hypothetical protein
MSDWTADDGLTSRAALISFAASAWCPLCRRTIPSICLASKCRGCSDRIFDIGAERNPNAVADANARLLETLSQDTLMSASQTWMKDRDTAAAMHVTGASR